MTRVEVVELGVFELDSKGRRCFRPDAPPFPDIDDIFDLLDPATAAVRAFDRALAAWPRPDLVGRLFARLDAVHSSGAEGSTTTFCELMRYQSAPRSAPDAGAAAAVAVYAEAVDTEPRSVDPVELALRIHRRLAAVRVPPTDAESGDAESGGAISGEAVSGEGVSDLKRGANGALDRDAPRGYFYYTRPSSVAAALDDWRTFTLGFDLQTPEIVRQILSHWMFAHIHPFDDGNGCIGRLLVPLILRGKGTTRAASAFFGEAVHEKTTLYVEALRVARLSGDMAVFTRLMLAFLERTAAANLARLARLAEVDAQWRRLAALYPSDSMVHKLAPFALTRPVFTLREALDAVGGTFAGVNTAATRLVEAGMLSVADDARHEPAVPRGRRAGDFRPVLGGEGTATRGAQLIDATGSSERPRERPQPSSPGLSRRPRS